MARSFYALGAPISRRLPINGLTISVDVKMDQARSLHTIQVMDGVMQAPFWILGRVDGKRVINDFRPLLFFKCCQDQLLSPGRPPEPLDNRPPETQLMQSGVPRRRLRTGFRAAGQRLSGGRRRRNAARWLDHGIARNAAEVVVRPAAWHPCGGCHGGNSRGLAAWDAVLPMLWLIRVHPAQRRGDRRESQFGQSQACPPRKDERSDQPETPRPMGQAGRFVGVFRVSSGNQPTQVVDGKSARDQCIDFDGELPDLPSGVLSIQRRLAKQFHAGRAADAAQEITVFSVWHGGR